MFNSKIKTVLLALLFGAMPMAAQSQLAKSPGNENSKRLQDSLVIQQSADEATYVSPWLKVSFSLSKPEMTFLSVDGAGEGHHPKNLLQAAVGAGPAFAVASSVAVSAAQKCDVSIADNVVRYTNIKLNDFETDSLIFSVEAKAIRVVIERDISQDYKAVESSPMRMMFDATVTPAAPLGRLSALGKLQFPVLIHFPDWGSLLVRAKDLDGEPATWDFSLFRDLKPLALGAVAHWRNSTTEEKAKVELDHNRYLMMSGKTHVGPEQIQLALHKGFSGGKQTAGKQHIELGMEVKAIYPEAAVVDADPKLVGVKRAWLNIFGFRADLGSVANSSTGDTCQFCLHCYADQAYFTPPLFDDFTALDLIRISLDRYFDGFKGYRDDFQDVAPSTIIAAWDYATGKPDPEWLKRRIGALEGYAQRMIDMDVDGDGLFESKTSPTNWWDLIRIDGKDAYSTALAYRAFRSMADLEHRVGDEGQASLYRHRADMIKKVYYDTFNNPQTGVLAGWRDNDGKLKDSYFLFANGIAIDYGLIEKPQANAILDKLQEKIKAVGFNSFQYGLPGNLITFPRTTRPFQVYQNGGVTGSMAYYYVQALYTMGRTAEAEAIFGKMLEGYRDGTFQNGIGNGGDWKEWNGAPSGYEGMLVDAYYPLTALITGRLRRGVPMP